MVREDVFFELAALLLLVVALSLAFLVFSLFSLEVFEFLEVFESEDLGIPRLLERAPESPRRDFGEPFFAVVFDFERTVLR
ncbi:MAG: hypothetical protein EBZ48_07330 [Proteobacteria bacterium]|nr:hypothetical protein [Pseudomonadota bacterium]